MMFAGMNFGLWYEVFFLRNRKVALRNREAQVFIVLVVLITFGIVYAWLQHDAAI
jgi:Trk-type K+ transport system membrane component